MRSALHLYELSWLSKLGLVYIVGYFFKEGGENMPKCAFQREQDSPLKCYKYFCLFSGLPFYP